MCTLTQSDENEIQQTTIPYYFLYFDNVACMLDAPIFQNLFKYIGSLLLEKSTYHDLCEETSILMVNLSKYTDLPKEYNQHIHQDVKLIIYYLNEIMTKQQNLLLTDDVCKQVHKFCHDFFWIQTTSKSHPWTFFYEKYGYRLFCMGIICGACWRHDNIQYKDGGVYSYFIFSEIKRYHAPQDTPKNRRKYTELLKNDLKTLVQKNKIFDLKI